VSYDGDRLPEHDNDIDLGSPARQWRKGYFGTDLRVGAGVWEDLRFPAQGINPPGNVGDPAVSTVTGLLEFSGTADNLIAGAAQMPHGWLEGTNVRPHIHLRFPTLAASKANRWKLEYDLGSVLGVFESNYGTYAHSDTITVANPNDIKLHALADFSEIDMAGHTVSAVIMWRLFRLANSDAADNDTTTSVLVELDFHYRADAGGSVQEYVKS